MYRTLDSQLSVYDFLPPYHGELSPDNRWVRLAAAVDWDAFEREYREAVGRICTAFADRADRVDRVVCGIGMRIK